jgi:multiple sugar transport system ATP-binding protein
MDEPLSNLDASMRTELREEIAELQKRLGVTTLYVTHDQTEAMTLGNRVVVMDKGEIQQVDTPQNIYCKPQNTFVSRFVGGNTMNLFRARCQERLGKVALVVGEHTIDIPEWKGQVLKEREYVGKEVIVGIRAEDIYPDCEGTVVPDTMLSMFEAKVEAVDVLGAEKKLHLRLGEEEISAMARTYASIEIGEQISLRLDVNQMHLFDAETELAILH